MTTRLAVALVVVFAGAVSTQQTVYEPGNGVTLPSVVKEVRPEYTERAKKSGARGTVWMKCVVDRDGKPADIVIVSERRS